MQPFTITCPTCLSQIRVRNPSLLGQLANCPKCDSMIMIARPGDSPQPPERAAPPTVGSPKVTVNQDAGSHVDSSALTRDGISVEIEDRYGAEAAEEEYRLADSDETDQVAPPVRSSSMPAWNTETPLIPSSEWTSESTNRTRQYLLVGFLGVASTLLAAVLFFGFLRWYSSERAPAESSPAEPLAMGEELTEPLVSGPAEEPGGEAKGEEPLVEETAGTGGTADTESLAPAEDNNAEALAEQHSPLNSEAVEPPTDNGAAGNQSLLPNTNAAQPEPAATVPAQEPALDLPTQLRAFGDVLDYELQPQFPDAVEILAAAPVTAEELGLDNSRGVEIPEVDVAAQSQAVFPAIVIAARPLAHFASLWSNISGIPTTVDIDSLAAAGIDRNQSVSLGLSKSATVGSLSAKVFEPLGLVSESPDNHFTRVFAPDSLVEQKLPSSLSLEGLIAGEADEQWLVASLSSLLPRSQLTWQIDKGELQRPAASTTRDWFSAVHLIEGWRLAAGLPPTVTAFTSQQLSAVFTTQDDVTGLNKVLSVVQAQERPLSQILPQICSEAQVHAWLDWPSLATLGVGTATTALVVTADRPLIRALSNYADEFSIVFAIVDSQTLLLTSNQAYRAQPQLYVMPSAGKTAEQWVAQLRPYTPAAGEGVGNTVVLPTPDGKYMLVRCCRPVVSF